MKKYLKITIIVLAVVCLVCTALILFDPFSRTHFRGEVASYEEKMEIIAKLNDELRFNTYSYKFTIKEDVENTYENMSVSSYIKAKGTATFDFDETFHTSGLSYEISGKMKYEINKALISGNTKQATTVKETTVNISFRHSGDEIDKYYVDTKRTIKADGVKSTEKLKTQDSSDASLSAPELNSYISKIDDDWIFYVTKNKYTIVSSTLNQIEVFEIKLSKDKIKKIEYSLESSAGKETVTFKIINYKRINQPKDVAEYKSNE